jgi:hypothetical protein
MAEAAVELTAERDGWPSRESDRARIAAASAIGPLGETSTVRIRTVYSSAYV